MKTFEIIKGDVTAIESDVIVNLHGKIFACNLTFFIYDL